MRKVGIILLPLYAGYIFYLILNLFLGSYGVLAMNDLERYKATLESNIETIKGNHRALTAELEGLKSDPETIALEARNIGYFQPDEGVIEIEGYSPDKNFYPVGRLLRYNHSQPFKKAGFRTVSMAVIMITVILLLVMKKKRHDPPKKRA